jgi:hypothetical protein
MSLNGSGVFNVNSTGQPVVASTLISASVFNAFTADVATALSTALYKDGQQTVTANLPMATYRHTGVGAAVATTDYARYDQVQNSASQVLSSVSGADTITANATPTPAAYAAGQTFRFVSAGANTGAVTLNVSALGAKAITKNGTTALVAGDIPSGAMVEVAYDGTRFQLGMVGLKAGDIGVSVQAYDADIPTVSASQGEMEAGTEAALRAMSPLRVAQAIAALGGGSTQIQPISASVAGNALTITAPSLTLDFRSATLTSGTVTTVTGDPADLVVSSGSTLGTVANIASRLAVIAMNNAGTIELAVRNVTAGANLDETGLISTTAEGGAGAADSATVNYSTTARSNLAYRVIGYVESTQATPGTWVTSPSTIQGEGGNAHAVASAAVIGTAVASASQTFIDFIGIPAWATEINISMTGGSLNATDYWRLQAGDAGGIENTGYVGAAVQVDTGSSVVFGGGGFDSISTAAANTRTGLFTLKLIDRATNTWICHALMVRTETAGDMYLTFGHKSLTDTLTQVRLTTGTGTSTMDAGSFNFSYK